MSKVEQTKLQLVELRTAIVMTIRKDEKEEFDAGFKLALLMNDEALDSIIKKTIDIITKKMKPYTDKYEELYDEYKVSAKDKDDEFLISGYNIKFGLTTFNIPDFQGNNEREQEFQDKVKELDEEFKDVLNELETFVNEKVRVPLEVVNVKLVPHELGYAVIKKLRPMLKF